MQSIINIIGWLQAHWTQILEILTSVIGTASLIVKITPTQKDDNILAQILVFLSKYIALNTDKHVDAVTK